MRRLFVALLDFLSISGDIKEANLFSSGTFSSIGFVYEGETYSLSISKVEKDGNDHD